MKITQFMITQVGQQSQTHWFILKRVFDRKNPTALSNDKTTIEEYKYNIIDRLNMYFYHQKQSFV